jgi:hypothetical protein
MRVRDGDLGAGARGSDRAGAVRAAGSAAGCVLAARAVPVPGPGLRRAGRDVRLRAIPGALARMTAKIAGSSPRHSMPSSRRWSPPKSRTSMRPGSGRPGCCRRSPGSPAGPQQPPALPRITQGGVEAERPGDTQHSDTVVDYVGLDYDPRSSRPLLRSAGALAARRGPSPDRVASGRFGRA